MNEMRSVIEDCLEQRRNFVDEKKMDVNFVPNGFHNRVEERYIYMEAN